MHGYSGDGGRVGAANIPSEYRSITLATSPAREEQAGAYRLLEDTYVSTFSRQFDPKAERIKSMYLYSLSPGTGKTATAIALLHEWIIVHYVGSVQRGQRPLERPGYFFDVNEWQELYNEFNRPKIPDDVAEPASREYYRRMKLAKTTPFVVMDDIGVRDCKDGFRGDLHSIINYRDANGLLSIYTSNVTIEELRTTYDSRLMDRVRNKTMTIPFGGESKRGLG